MTKKSRYLEQLQRRKAAAPGQDPGPTAKPVGEMTDAELAAELESARSEALRLSEEAVRLSREGTATRGAGRGFLSAKKRRPYWR